jgi:hypothetical protein
MPSILDTKWLCETYRWHNEIRNSGADINNSETLTGCMEANMQHVMSGQPAFTAVHRVDSAGTDSVWMCYLKEPSAAGDSAAQPDAGSLHIN